MKITSVSLLPYHPVSCSLACSLKHRVATPQKDAGPFGSVGCEYSLKVERRIYMSKFGLSYLEAQCFLLENLGVDCFSILFSLPSFSKTRSISPRDFVGFLERRIPGRNGEVAPGISP